MKAMRYDIPAAFPPTLGTPDDGSVISNVDIGPNDVLCGRGLRISKNPGNIKFLDVVASRKTEYFAAKTKKEKQRIAKEIVDHVRHRTEPPGQFFELVDKNAPFWNEKWCLVNDETALEKVKQALRNKQKSGVKEQKPKQLGKRPKSPTRPKTEPQPVTTAVAVDDVNAVSDDSDDAANRMEPPALQPEEAPGNEKQPVATTPTTTKKAEEVTMADGRANLLDSIHIAVALAEKTRAKHAGVVSSGDLLRSDLVDLGSALYKFFAGVDPYDSEMSSPIGESPVTEMTQPKKKERQSDRQSFVPLRDLGLPVSLSILVSSLLNAKNDDVADRYMSAEEVVEDLRLMTSDPDRYMFDADSEKQSGRLQVPEGRLYGREKETLRLMGAFDRVVGPNGKPEMALISGYSGTGKSVLVEQLRKPLSLMKGHFVSGKFYELGQVQPIMIIFAAFNEYCKDVLEGDKDNLAQMRSDIKDALGWNSSVLTDLIPNLRGLIGEPTSACLQVGGKEALNRLFFYFRSFVRAIASPSHPVILFLDDLQWADQASLDLVSMLLLDTSAKSFLFVGCYRDNEVGDDHPLNAEVKKIMQSGVTISNIKLENIDCKSVNALISDTLHLSPRVTQSLANVVYSKTSGNPLFAVQFLQSLFEEKVLHYSATSRRWEWDVKAIQSKDIADNVVDLVREKMQKLASASQWLLGLAACLGTRCEASTLELLNAEGADILPFLDAIVDEGIMYKTGSCYKFSHDRIQEAAYALIPVTERCAVHLHVGRLLWKRVSTEELRNIIFIVVDQLQRGFDLVSDYREKVKIAELCQMAGEKAMSSSSFLQASVYLLQGTVLLEERDWKSQYDLCLKLFTSCAEAQYTTGNYEGVAITLNPILLNGRCLQDKLPAFYTLLNALGAQGKYLDVIDTGCNVLAQLEEPFQSEANQQMVMKEFAKTRELLGGYSSDQILKKDRMQDRDKVAVMRLLMILVKYAFYVKPELNGLMFLRMIQLTLSHGLCKESAFAFAGFSMILCKFSKYDVAYHYGKLATSLADKVNADEYLPRITCIVNSFINSFNEPLQASLPTTLRMYDVAMSNGDIEWSLTNARMYILNSIHGGRTLEPLADEVKVFVQQMKEHRHHLLQIVLPLQQAILNLTGCSDDPVVLTGEAMNQDELLANALESQQLVVVENVYFHRLWLAYMFRRFDVAAEMVEKCPSLQTRQLELVAHETFYIGLVAAVMARGSDKRCDWRSIAIESMEKMKAFASSTAWNFQHKLDLLNAEIAHLNGDVNEAIKAYEDAIRTAGEHGFIHEQAIACERAGCFYSEVLGPDIAVDFYQRSHEYYLKWGAKRKAEMIFCDHLMTGR